MQVGGWEILAETHESLLLLISSSKNVAENVDWRCELMCVQICNMYIFVLFAVVHYI